MNNDRTKKLFLIWAVVLLALALPVALALVGGWRMWQESRARSVAEAEFGEALRQSLERAADVVLPSPTLGERALIVECAMDNFEGEVQRVVRLAEGVGGTASSWNDGMSVRIVANVPRSAETLFRESVERGIYDLNAAGETKPMVMVEVLLRPVEPKPTPRTKKARR